MKFSTLLVDAQLARRIAEMGGEIIVCARFWFDDEHESQRGRRFYDGRYSLLVPRDGVLLRNSMVQTLFIDSKGGRQSAHFDGKGEYVEDLRNVTKALDDLE